MRSNKQEIIMGICETEVIQEDIGIFTHIPKYSGIFRYDILMYIIRHIHDIITHIQDHVQSWHKQSPGIFRTKTYLEPEAFPTPVILKILAYSVPYQASTMENYAKLVSIIIVTNHTYFHKTRSSRSLKYEFFKEGLILLQK